MYYVFNQLNLVPDIFNRLRTISNKANFNGKIKRTNKLLILNTV